MEFPFAATVTFSEEELKALKDSEYRCIRVQSFNVANLSPVKYFVEIYPNGNVVEKKGKTMIFLYFQNVDLIEIKYTFKIESANWVSESNRTFKKQSVFTTPGWGAICCNTNDLFDAEKKYFIDGKVTIEVSGVAKNEVIPVAILKQKFDDLGVKLFQNKDKDLKIVIKNQDIKVHKIVLAARSSVFSTMFQSEFKEGQENKIEIYDFPYEVVEFGITRCYGINELYILTMKNNMLLLQFFEKYNMQKFKDELESHLIGQIGVLNVCDLVNTSLKAKSPKLTHYCAEYLLECMRASVNVPNYVSLDHEFAIQLLGKSLSARLNT